MIFAAILMAATFITGLVWLVDKTLLSNGKYKNNKIIDGIKGFFPVLLAVFLIRSFVVEPFKIPSGSMMPTLIAGDFIAVNKFSYGLRLPVFNKKILSLSLPERGDVFVFHYPKDPSIDYIKRVIGEQQKATQRDSSRTCAWFRGRCAWAPTTDFQRFSQPCLSAGLHGRGDGRRLGAYPAR